MCCKSFWKRIVPFILTLMFGLVAVNFLQNHSRIKSQENLKTLNEITYLEKGIGYSGGKETIFKEFVNDKPTSFFYSGTSKLQILSKPFAKYTNDARQNGIEGKVRLRVVFLASGQIGQVLPVKNLPYGLTEQAIASAKQIKFKPKIIKGKPITVIKIIEYNFTIY